MNRTPISWIRERDVDLLVCAELHANERLRSLISSETRNEHLQFKGAWVSHAEREGESDLVVEWSSPQGRELQLIENKIAANFQPDQGERYRLRAQRIEKEPDVARVTTVLVAPKEYFLRSGCASFERLISYEQIDELLREEGDPRSIFLANVLRDGIKAYRSGYVPVPDEEATAVWSAIWAKCLEKRPALRMKKPDSKPARSQWIYFRNAEGLGDWKKMVVVWKAERGQVDLQFSGMSAEELFSRTASILLDGMQVVKAGKSASIRILCEKVDFGRSPDQQPQAIANGLELADQIRCFAATHNQLLLT